MNETFTTVVGNVCTDVKTATTRSGAPVASFRVASTTRRYDRAKGGWYDADTLFVTVLCYRQLAEHVASSFGKGEPVLVAGRLRVRDWSAPDGRTGTAVELEATAAGHDLNRGTSAFKRAPRPAPEQPDRVTAEELATAVALEPVGELVSDESARGDEAAA
jgi:single-strand DNA-binding protein